MAKDKKRNLDDSNKKETLFYYETIGIIFIVLSCVLLLKLGVIGYWLYAIFKVLFGDFYFIFVFFMLFYGFYSLFKHIAFDIKNQKFIGFLLLSLGVMIFSHISVHNYIIELEGSYFNNTWNIYWSYLTLGYGEILGGGLLGALVFYLVYTLFGIIGVCLIASLIVMLGISLFINKSIIEMFIFFINRVKNIGKYSHNFRDFFKYELGSRKINKEQSLSIYLKNIQVPLKILEEYKNDINIKFQEKLGLETKGLIHSVFSSMNLEYKDINVIVSYQVTTYYFYIFSKFDIDALLQKLKNIIDEDILYGQESNRVVIQINNKNQQIVNLRSILIKQNNLLNNYYMPLGISFENKLVEIDISNNTGIVLVGNKNSGISNFLLSFLISLYIKNNLINYTVELFDDNDELVILHSLVERPKLTEVNNYLEIIKTEIDERIELMSKLNCNSFGEYNRKLEIEERYKELLPNKYIIINPSIIEDKPSFADKLLYVTQSGIKVGYFIIFILRDIDNCVSLLGSLFDIKIIFKSSKELSHKMLGNNKGIALLGAGDAIISNKAKQTRFQSAYVSKRDLQEVIKYLK